MKFPWQRQLLSSEASIPIVAWTVFIALLAGLTIYTHHRGVLNEARSEVRDYFRLNLAYRAWASRLGGVYADSGKVEPNPHLNVPHRDVTTTDGRQLTLVNPAYMTRMVFDTIKNSSPNPTVNKITSLVPLNPDNAPDAWEEQALLEFERGLATERSEIAHIDGKPYLRFIAPFFTDTSCLACHGSQGYKVGDVRGGITISIPLEGYYHPEARTRKAFSAGYLLLWAVGTGGIAASTRRRRRYEEEVRTGEEKFRTVCDWTQDWEYWVDQHGSIKYISPSCEEITGYGRDDFLDDPDLLHRLVLPEDRDLFDAHRLQGAGDGAPSSVEFRIVTAQGNTRWIHHTCRPVLSGGQFLGTRASNRDITDRKLAEQELAVRAELLNAVSDSVFVIDPTGKILDANEAAWRTRGYSREEILALQAVDLDSPEYAPYLQQRLDQVLACGGGELESEHVRKDGSRISVEMNTRVIDYRGRKAILCSVRDVTQRKETDAILLRTTRFNVSLNRISQAFLKSGGEEQMYRELLVALLEVMESPCGMVGYLDDMGNLVFSAATTGTGEAASSLLVFPSERWGDSLWGAALRSGQPSFANTAQPVPETHFRVDRCLVVPLVCQGRAIALLMVANRDRDYTEDDLQMLKAIGAQVAPVLEARIEQQRAVVALKENERKLQVIFDVIQSGIVQVDHSGLITFANQRMAEMFGLPMDRLLGSDYTSHVSPEQREESQGRVRMLLDGELQSAQYETSYLRSDGTSFPGFFTARRMVVSGEKQARLVATVTDMTDLKSAEEKRLRSEQQMLHVQKLESLGVLAGGIAHDFNNILLAIMGNTSLALQQVPAGTPVETYLRQVERASEKAADLARQMLAYSGKGKFVLETVDLNRLVREMTSMLEVSLSKKAVLSFNLSEPLPGILADPTQIRQIVMNLAINASEAIGDASGVITIATGSLYCDRNYLDESWMSQKLPEGDYVFLEVTDTGCGMSRETAARIFEPFFTTKFTGRGLGMSAILGIVRGHKGAIKVYSEPGKGSSFKILLPATEPPDEEIGAGDADTAWQGSGTVLLVDDEETVRQVTGAMLMALGYSVVTAVDGRDALDKYRECGGRIALVLMDLNMPNLNGEEAFHELRRMDAKVRVVLSSGFSEQEVTRKFLGKGLEGFIQKPYTLAALKNLLSRI